MGQTCVHSNSDSRATSTSQIAAYVLGRRYGRETLVLLKLGAPLAPRQESIGRLPHDL
jgi:hypothetical protein